MTDVTPTDEMQARVEQLRASRASRGDKAAAPRRHPAAGARIGAAGFGLATMLGLVGVMGYANRSTSTATQPSPSPTPAPQIVVVVHHNPASSSATTSAQTVSATTPAAQAAPTAPIALTAQPVVQQAPAAQTPIATTHGSR